MGMTPLLLGILGLAIMCGLCNCQADDSCVLAGMTTCCESNCGLSGCFCDVFCYHNGDCCSDIIQICCPETGVVIGFENATYTVNEEAGTLNVTVHVDALLAAVIDPVTFTLVTSTGSGTATSNQDFVPTSTQISVGASTLEVVEQIVILNDNIYDPDEQFSLTLLYEQDLGCATVVNSATVTIVDNDPICIDGSIRIFGDGEVFFSGEGSGSGSFEANEMRGSLEFCRNATWGTICNDSWVNTDASVACRELGYSPYGAIAVTEPYFVPIGDPVSLYHIDCNGSELSLGDCPRNDVSQCIGFNEAGIVCQDIATIGANCDDGDIRLSNGSTSLEGRVEICINNAWGTICDGSWDNSDASVVCQQLGFSAFDAVALPAAHFGPGIGPIFLTEVQCSGQEESLQACGINTPLGIHSCLHQQDASVSCQVEEEVVIGFRTVDLTVDESVGVAAIDVAILSGTLRETVMVVISTREATDAEFQATGAIGSNLDLRLYTGDGTTTEGLDYSGLSGVTFTLNTTAEMTVTVPIIDDDVAEEDESFTVNLAFLAPTSFAVIDPSQAVITIQDDDAVTIGLDAVLYIVSEAAGTVFVSVSVLSGMLESSATLVLRTEDDTATSFVDYTPADATLVFNQDTTNFQVSIPIINDNIPEGDETFIVNLGISDSSERNVTVDPAQALVVILYSELATPPECITSSIRLGDSDTGFEGRVEVCVNGNWSTVCDESWDYLDAVVTCTQLGLPSYGAFAYGDSQFGGGSGPIGLTDVECSGSEQVLLLCPNGGNGGGECTHLQDAGVQCFGGVSDCDCTRNVECNIDGRLSGTSDLEITGKELKCTLTFDQELLQLARDYTHIDATFDVDFLSVGSILLLNQLGTIPRGLGFDQCVVEQELIQHGDPATVLQALGVERLSVTYLQERGEYGSFALDTQMLQQIALDGDFAMGVLGPDNACLFQHLTYWLTTAPSLSATTCRTPDASGATVINFNVAC